jgi:hypothetical protein
VDTEFMLDVDKGWTRTLRATKMKDAPSPAPLRFRLKQIQLPWKDADGEPETSVVLLPSDSVLEADTRLTATAQLALRALQDTLRDNGTPPPDDWPDAPPKVVQEQAWRRQFYQCRGADKPATLRKAFIRARDELAKLEKIVSREELVGVPE